MARNKKKRKIFFKSDFWIIFLSLLLIGLILLFFSLGKFYRLKNLKISEKVLPTPTPTPFVFNKEGEIGLSREEIIKALSQKGFVFEKGEDIGEQENYEAEKGMEEAQIIGKGDNISSATYVINFKDMIELDENSKTLAKEKLLYFAEIIGGEGIKDWVSDEVENIKNNPLSFYQGTRKERNRIYLFIYLPDDYKGKSITLSVEPL